MYISKPKPIDTTKTIVKNDADLTFAVLGDVHENTDNFQEAINDLYTINPVMDALVLNGDIVDQGTENQYDSVKKTLSKNKDLLPKTIIKNIGNHEFFDYGAGINSPEKVQTLINRYLEFAGEEKVYHDTWLKDYHFISLGSENNNSETSDSVRAFISENQQKWLKEKLAEDGIEIELVKFTDYATPNVALAEGELDLNSFQTKIFMDSFNKDHDEHLVAIADTVIAPLGIYSSSIQDLSEIKEKDVIAIPNDVSNEGRALLLLQTAG